MEGVNYVNTFIAVAEDSVVDHGIEPPVKPDNASIVARQFAMISERPYTFTSEDVIFGVHADRAEIPERDRPAERAAYFAKGRPCLRASDLGKKYGWGVHCDAECRLALFGVNTPGYSAFMHSGQSGTRCIVRAMRSSRK